MKPKSAKKVVEETGVSYFAWSIITDGFFSMPYYKRYMGKPLTLEIMFIKDGHGQWSVSLDNLAELTKSSFNKLKKGTYALNEIYKLHHAYGNKVILNSKHLLKYLNNITNPQLVVDVQKNWNDFLHLNCLGTVLVWTDIDNNLFTEHLKKILSARGVDDSKIHEYLSVLVSQNQPNFQWQETLKLLRIGVANKSCENSIYSHDFIKHCEDYRWIQYGFHGPEVNRNYFAQRLKKAFSKGIKEELRRHLLHFKEIKKQQLILEKKLKLSQSEKRLFDWARKIMYLKAYRVDVRYYFHWVMDSIFKEISREFKVPYQWFHYAERDDIINLILEKKVNIRFGMQRVKYLLRVKDGIKTEFYNKKDGEVLLSRLLTTNVISQTSEIRGNVAYAGIVKGTVCIIRSAKDIPKIKKGDILVAMATNPDLLPAMYKAAAFVTDSGGITSHAAIVAREMKKPCIIGTKIASSVLKDGDKVEVDATRGIIRKI